MIPFSRCHSGYFIVIYPIIALDSAMVLKYNKLGIYATTAKASTRFYFNLILGKTLKKM
jgi:hypothetical protein